MAKQWKGIAKDFISAMRQNFIGKGADPNAILVQDLYNFESSPKSKSFPALNGIRGNTGQQTSKQMFEQLFDIYKEHITNKRELLTQARALFDTDVVQTIIDVIMDDGFNSFIDDKDEFRIEYHLPEEERDVLGETYEQEIQEHIDEFVEKFAIKSRIPEMIPELLRDGEYAYGIITEQGKGITEIVDDLDVINLLPFYLNDKLALVMKQDERKNGKALGSSRYNVANNALDNDKPLLYKPDNIIFFRLKYFQKERINMSDFYNTEYRNNFYMETGIRLPKFMRICRPIYYSAIKSLNKLQIMENLNTILEMYAILRPEIVHVSVPSTTSPGEATQIIRDYERRLNETSTFTDADTLDMTTLAAMANKRTVLPQWLDGKGTLSMSSTNETHKAKDSWENIDKLRTLIASSVGIPAFYVTLNSTPVDKHQIVKLYSRYTKKLTSLQKSLADGIKDLLVRHLKLKGLNISVDNILVKFKSLTSGDSLDDTDMMVATVEGINNLYKGIEEICSSEHNDLVMDSEQFKELFDSLTSKYLNISNLIKVDPHKFDDPDSDFNDGAGSPSDVNFEDNEGPSIEIGADERAPGSEDTSYEEFENSTESTTSGGTLVENPDIGGEI